MANVITLTGPSMCGKSRVIKQMEFLSQTEKYKDIFSVIKMPKYTTRPFRENEIKAIQSGDIDDIDVIPVVGEYNNLPDVSAQELHEMKFAAFSKLGCDLVYEQYGYRYGIKLSDLYEYIRNGISPIVILNDVRVIEDIKGLLGKQCISLFIFRDVPNLERFQIEGKKRNDTDETIRTRYEKATAIYRIYIENIALFDNLILNVQQGDASLRNILEQLIELISRPPVSFI